MENKKTSEKFLISFLLLGIIVFLISKFFYKKDQLKTTFMPPKEIQYFCQFSENKSNYLLEVIKIDWIKNVITIKSSKKAVPYFTKEKLDYPIIEGKFSFKNQKVLFQSTDGLKNYISFPVLNSDANNFLNLDWNGERFGQESCPWYENSFVKNIKDLYVKKKISILCFKNPENSANSVFIFDPKEKTFWLWGTTTLANWNILNETPSNKGPYGISGNIISINESDKETKSFKISKIVNNQILELKFGKITLSQNECTWISEAAKLEAIKNARDSYYCLNPFTLKSNEKLKIGKENAQVVSTEPLNYGTKNVVVAPNKSSKNNMGTQVSSVIKIDLTKKYFSIFGNFYGNITELIKKPSDEGIITLSGKNILFESNKGKILFKGLFEGNKIKINNLEFNNDFCSF